MIDLDDRLKWIDPEGVRILYMDYSNLKSSTAMIQLLKAGFEQVEKEQGSLRWLANFTKCSVSYTFAQAALKADPNMAHKIECSAIYGASGISRMIANAFFEAKLHGKVFNHREEALAFLTGK